MRAELLDWYAEYGRDLPWRHTRDPYAILVSEVMLQQTQVPRVIPYWHEFMSRWPDPGSFAAAAVPEVLRAWQGLGYPRRAIALHDTAMLVAGTGWPRDETALRALPGIGRYTARALLTLALGEPSPPPLDVNIARVAGRAGAGRETADLNERTLEDLITVAKPRSLDRRHYTFALFDAGALHCRARPRCDGCPLRGGCVRLRQHGDGMALGRAAASAARARDDAAATRVRRPSAPYSTSMRRLRGVLLAAALCGGGDLTPYAARAAAAAVSADLPPARDPSAVERAVASLRADRLIGRSEASATGRADRLNGR